MNYYHDITELSSDEINFLLDLAKRLAYWLVKNDYSKKRVNDIKKDVLPSLTYRGASLSKQEKQDWWDEVCNIIDYSE